MVSVVQGVTYDIVREPIGLPLKPLIRFSSMSKVFRFKKEGFPHGGEIFAVREVPFSCGRFLRPFQESFGNALVVTRHGYAFSQPDRIKWYFLTLYLWN
ncbi:hypothetical protein [Thermococcus gammatolerans]|uniref:Uncharacterized protein n=1 Tax=Thermococcus gammatolerans (strain DSM 15229 / JCM 11827 / EJ3) TaxID=593117 RepID=C5A4W6_THEGJ|nr:hypothetical protein [Thermococcus gammatolerans]ACS33278.1 Hypothetical protein TGAM_0776 [Thermococcus gammatolerans EJ3]